MKLLTVYILISLGCLLWMPRTEAVEDCLVKGIQTIRARHSSKNGPVTPAHIYRQKNGQEEQERASYMAGGLRGAEKGFEELYVCVCVILDRGKTVECKS